MKRNKDIRDLICSEGLYIWEVAESIGISDVTMSKKLRKELTKEEKEQVKMAIETIKKSRR